MERKVIGAIDLGASGGKMFAGIFDENGFSVEEVARFPNEPVNVYQKDVTCGRAVQKTYWNDLEILQNIIKSLKQASLAGIDGFDALGIDTWGTDGVVLNKYGEPLDRLYNYRDHRLDGIEKKLFKIISEKELYFLTGIPSLQFNQLNQFFWLKENRREYLDCAELFLPVSSLFYYYLGGYKFAEYTWASTTQLLEPFRKQWNAKVFEKLGLPVNVMPELLPPGRRLGPVFGEILRESSLSRCSLFTTASHDTAAAYFAAPSDADDNSLIISSGTWSLVGKLVPEPIINCSSFEKKFSNEGGVGNIRFLKNVMGTWLIQELKRNWEEEGTNLSWEDIVKSAEAGSEFYAFIDPDHESFFNPDNMESAIKNYCRETGQPVPERREDILRICYESLAMKCRKVNSDIEEASGSGNKTICIVGGGAQNALLNAFTASACGLPVHAGPVEATAAGSILVQARALGLVPGGDCAKLVKEHFEINVFKPEETARWEKNYKNFIKTTGKTPD